MDNFRGVIIEESLKEIGILKKMKVDETKVETVTAQHKTPWLKKWTLHTVSVPAEEINLVSEELSRVLLSEPSSWYADLKSSREHYIIYPNKVFKVDRSKPKEYEAVTRYGVSRGIPEYQLDFSPEIK